MRPRISTIVMLVAAVAGLVFTSWSTYDFVQHLDRQRGAAGGAEPEVLRDRRRIDLILRCIAQQRPVHRRHSGEAVDLLAHHRFEHDARLEARYQHQDSAMKQIGVHLTGLSE